MEGNYILESHSALSRFKAREGMKKDEFKEVTSHILVSKIRRELFKWLEDTGNLITGIEIATKNKSSCELSDYSDSFIQNKIDKKLFIFRQGSLKIIWDEIQEGDYIKALELVLFMRVKEVSL